MFNLELIGNIGNDAVIKQQSNSAEKFVTFNVANSVRTKDVNGNEVEKTTWVSVLMNGDGGRILPYLKKGTKVFVRGRASFALYQGQNGPAIDVRVTNPQIELLGDGRKQNEEPTSSDRPF